MLGMSGHYRNLLVIGACTIVAGFLGGCNALKAAGDAIGNVIDIATPPPAKLPRTTAERTNYLETSRYADVVGFIDSLQALGLPIHVGSIGRSTDGRDIPYIVASRPLVTTPAEARRLGRPVVYVQANIHAGEVEGKEALLALVRDLVVAQKANVLDSIVLVAIPIYNTDGNERVAAQARNRGDQNGPEMVGERSNGQRLDLNRDYVKAEAPETRASLAMFEKWDPEVFVDLHTTDGSYHGYALTYSPSLNPAATYGGPYARDSLLPQLRERVRSRHHFEVFDYGNFSQDFDDLPTDSVKKGWFTYDHRPRFGTNYYGLRGRVAILSEAMSHDPFERRVKATYAFVTELLSLVAEKRTAIIEIAAAADAHPTRVARGSGCTKDAKAITCDFGSGDQTQSNGVAIRSELTTTPFEGDIIVEKLVSTGDSSLTQPGVTRGLSRTGQFYTQRMKVYDRFMPTLEKPLPAAYAIADRAEMAPVIALLRLHGLVIERTERSWSVRMEAFTVDSLSRSVRPFQGHNEVRAFGRWRTDNRTVEQGTWVIPADQPLAVVAAYLLEPESDDGFVDWNVFDNVMTRGGEFPVLRITGALTVPRRVSRAP